MERTRSFPGISPSAWEHPADRAALAAFSSLPLAGELVRRVLGSTTERSLRLAALANSARVGESQFAPLHLALKTMAERLDLDPLPELYVRLDPAPDARTLGVDKPFIVLSSGALDLWDEEEIGCVLAHELGHVLSGHAVFKTLLALLIQASALIAGGIPLAGAAVAAASAALKEWDRKSELSADRAGLIAVQDAPLVFRCLMKSAAGPRVGQMDINEFFRQARDYETSREGMDSLFKLIDILDETHPFPVSRITALQEWEKGGAYQAILAGDYPRRGAAGERDPARDFKSAGESYSAEFSASEDPLSQAAGKVMEALNGIFGQGQKGDRAGQGRQGEGPGPSIEDAIDRIFGKRP
jgi:Zn-dependent protease with chaperone function